MQWIIIIVIFAPDLIENVFVGVSLSGEKFMGGDC